MLHSDCTDATASNRLPGPISPTHTPSNAMNVATSRRMLSAPTPSVAEQQASVFHYFFLARFSPQKVHWHRAFVLDSLQAQPVFPVFVMGKLYFHNLLLPAGSRLAGTEGLVCGRQWPSGGRYPSRL